MILEAAGESTHRRARADPWLWGALGIGLALRAGLLWRYPHLPGLGDEIIHYAMGRMVEAFGTASLGQWAPLYDLLLGGVFRLAGPDPAAAKAVQVGISTATIALVYAIAAGSGSRRAARIAAWLCAVDPTLIAFTHALFTETLYVALLAAFAAALFARPGPRTRAQLVGAGVAFGLATLTRSVGLYFLPLWLGVAAIRRDRRALREIGAVLLVALAVVAPWTVRNAFKYHAFMLVDGTLGRTAYLAFSERFFSYDLGYATGARQAPDREACRAGPAPGAPDLPPARALHERFDPTPYGLAPSREAVAVHFWRARRFATEDLAAVQRCELANAAAFVREHPGTVARHVLQRLYAFWGPNSYLLRAVAGGVYPGGPLARAAYPVAEAVVVLLHVATIGCALLLYGRRRLPSFAPFLALFAAYYTFVHAAAVAYSRYRLPLMPFVFVAAGLWLASPSLPEGRARRVAIGAALAGFAALCAHYAAVVLP